MVSLVFIGPISLTRLVISIRFFIFDTRMLDAGVVSSSHATALAESVFTTNKISATRDGNLQVSGGWCQQYTLLNYTCPAHAQFFFQLALRRMVYDLVQALFACAKGVCSHCVPHQSLARCHPRTTQTIRRTSPSTHTRRQPGHSRQLDKLDSAPSHNGSVWLSGRTNPRNTCFQKPSEVQIDHGWLQTIGLKGLYSLVEKRKKR